MQKITTWSSLITIIWVLLILLSSCNKKNENSNSSQITDIDGNVYHSVTIGTQVWMVENLKTTRFNDGTKIPLVPDQIDWNHLLSPGYCWYNNDPLTNKNPYGALYNWFAINTGKLAPTGWHVPSDAEWTTLSDFLGGEDYAGGKMKELGTSHWASPNTGGTNSSGFTALPGGWRGTGGSGDIAFNNQYRAAFFWSSTQWEALHAYSRTIWDETIYIARGTDDFTCIETQGFSIRCLKD